MNTFELIALAGVMGVFALAAVAGVWMVYQNPLLGLASIFFMGIVLALLITVGALIYYFIFMKHPTQLSKVVHDDALSDAMLASDGTPQLVDGVWLSGGNGVSSGYLGRLVANKVHTHAIVDMGDDMLLARDKENPEVIKIEVTNAKKYELVEHLLVIQQPGGVKEAVRPKRFEVLVFDRCELLKHPTTGKLERAKRPEMNAMTGKPEWVDDWEEHHSALNGEVTLDAPSLKKVGRFRYLSTQAENPIIDWLRYKEAIRAMDHLIIDRWMESAESGVNANGQHIAEQQGKNLLDNIPLMRPTPVPGQVVSA